MEFTHEFNAEEWNKIERDFSRLKDKCYLDHAGSALYGESQLSAIHKMLGSDVFCNPHTSQTMEEVVDLVRYRILRWFNTCSSEYDVVFTSGTTSALKLIGESFAFHSPTPMEANGTGAFVYLRESHTSVLGMREIVKTNRIYPIERCELLQMITHSEKKVTNDISKNHRKHPSLLVFPAQCNFNGTKYPLELCEVIAQNGLHGYEKDDFHVCLDAASFVSTSWLDLSLHRPSFVCLSFYKIFGFPTGLGALLVRKDIENLLLPGKRYYGGGTVKIAMSGSGGFHVKRDTLSERFEDGTINFLSIISLLPCMDSLEQLIGPMPTKRMQRYTFQLARYCYSHLLALTHSNGQRVIQFYHDTAFDDEKLQGAIINFNVRNDDGSYIGYAQVACMAANHGIYLRTGCFCNPGACQRHLRLADHDILRQFQAGHVCGDKKDLIDGQPTGSVRVSFGYYTHQRDIDKLVSMLTQCFISRSQNKLLPSHSNIVAQNQNFDKPRLVQICIYPVKSCGAIKTQNWQLSATGLQYDREFVIINEQGVALTQKKIPSLCLIQPTIDLQCSLLILRHPDAEDDLILDLRWPSTDQAKVESSNGTGQIQLCQTKVCADAILGVDCGERAAEWVSVVLGVSNLRLIRQSSHYHRIQRRTAKELSLNNQAQLLLVNRTSVRWLGEKVQEDAWEGLEQVPSLESLVDRFRGNFIIETSRPLEEMDWSYLRIAENRFTIDGPCTRCQMICIDQVSGKHTSEPLRTISREFGGKMQFGIYLSHEAVASEVMLYCGDIVSSIDELR